MEKPNSDDTDADIQPNLITVKTEPLENEQTSLSPSCVDELISNIICDETKEKSTKIEIVPRTRASRRIQERQTDKKPKASRKVKNAANHKKEKSARGKTRPKTQGNQHSHIENGRNTSAKENNVDDLKMLPPKKRSQRQKSSTGSGDDDDGGGGDEQNDPDYTLPDKTPKKRLQGGPWSKLSKASKTNLLFQCTLCNSVLKSATGLKIHMLTHNNFQCKYCGIQLGSQMSLNKHEQRHRLTESTPHYKCKHCDLTWVRKHYHEKHEKLCAGPHTCNHCNKTYSNLRLLKKHKRSRCPANSNSYKKSRVMCTYCGKMLHKRNIKDHSIQHTGVSPHCCCVCGQFFRSRRTLLRHERFHKETGKVNLSEAYQCRYCNKECKSQLYLDFHENRHQGKSPYQCDKCQETFFHVNKYYEHQRVHQGKTSQKCNICSKTYKNNRSLLRHLKTHTKEEAVQCGICLKMFSTPGNLKVHQRIHTQEVQFPCKHCHRIFVQKSHLQYHEQSHRERVMYDCPECDAKYTTSYYRDMHLRMKHTKKDLPTCPHCKKIFQAESALKRHIYSVCAPDTEEENLFCRHCGDKMKNTLYLDKHVKEKHAEYNYTCKICNYVAGKSSCLKTHMRRHTGERPFKCGYCDRAFKQKTTLKNHERLHTGEKPYK